MRRNGINCFTPTGDRFVEGVEMSLGTDNQQPSVCLIVGETVRNVPVAHYRDTHSCDTRVVYSARACVERRQPILVPRNGWQGVVLRVRTGALSFGFDPLADNLVNVWIGGDDIPLAQVGSNTAPEKDQLFALNDGRRMLIVDPNQRVGWIEVRGCKPNLRAATRDEVIDYVEQKARRINQVRAYTWAFHLIESLGGDRNILDRLERAQATLRRT